jgi:hypothetical protein
MTARLRAGLVAAMLAAATLLACGDPNAPDANFSTYTDTLALYALNGAPPGAPTAVRLFGGVTLNGSAGVTTDVGFNFDVAVDVDDQGQAVLYTVRAVAAPFLGRHRVGIRRSDQAFDAIGEAPRDSYAYDSLAVVSVGETVLIESADAEASSACVLGGVIYGKMIVDSVRTADRRVFARVTANPNCGFRSFASGVPTR